ncbi:acyl-CoA dehydrogenase family protein [Nocardioides sp. NBC_00163]|uniref:acyl-CoA dehydrogenase family protein n=1 Tax=Nocardioides sp. NBC_00163 TaxID=2975999 RepID=UPI0032464A55
MTAAVAEQTTTPSEEEILNRVRELQPVLAERARKTEQDGRVSAETTALIKAAGLHKLCLPARYGGFELGPTTWLKVGFEMGRACASTSWAVLVGNSCTWFATYWPLEVHDELWAESPDSTVCLSGIPTGKAVPVDGGYEISGSWGYSSNSDNSEWAVVSAVTSVNGEPSTTWFMVETKDLEIDQDSWQVSGLAGTGSKTLIRRDPLFVPHHRVVTVDDITAGKTPGQLAEDNAVARWNFSTLGGVILVAPLLGAAQGALDWFTETMRTKVKTSLKAGAGVPAAANPFIQAKVGEASAKIDAAMALLETGLKPHEAKVLAGEEISIAERVRLRRDVGFATRQAIEAVNLLMEGASASATSLQVPFQRFWRDVIAGTRHVTLDSDGIFAMSGQEQLGLPPIGPH